MGDKKLKTWKKLFNEPDDEQKVLRKIKEIDVLLSELGSLKQSARLYRGAENSVLFSADLSATKADLKKEKNALKKNVGASSDVLAF